MTKIKVEKILVISFIGFVIPFFVILGGNPVLRAGLPSSVPKTDINFEKRLQSLEDDLASGQISKRTYDSLSDLLHMQIQRTEALNDDDHNPDKMPGWVTKLGISEPEGMKFDQVFSHYTLFSDPSERFNSVSLVYTGDYAMALEEATRIANNTKLTIRGNPVPRGRLQQAKRKDTDKKLVRFLNYDLEHADQDFLISIEVEPSGRLTIVATDNKQLNACLMAYEPLNNRVNSALKQKKQ